jgi:hypothetical protein
MSGTDHNARKAVNDALINAGSAGVGQIVDTANSSVEKRRRNREERAKREAEEKAAKEKADAAVCAQEPDSLTCCMLIINCNNRKAALLVENDLRVWNAILCRKLGCPEDRFSIDLLQSETFHSQTVGVRKCWHFTGLF